MTPIAITVVNFNTRDHLRRCLQSLQQEPAEQVVVVDNGSSDGSADMVRTEFPTALCLDSVNSGYGAGANRGIAYCSSPYVLLLNSDTILRPGTLHLISDYLDRHPGAAILGPRLIGEGGQ